MARHRPGGRGPGIIHNPHTTGNSDSLAAKLGTLLRDARVKSGMSLHAAAHEVNIDRQVLHEIEEGEHILTVQTVEHIALVVGWDWESFFKEVGRRLR